MESQSAPSTGSRLIFRLIACLANCHSRPSLELAELIDVLAWSGSARIGLHTRYIFIVLTIKCSTVQRICVLDVIVGAAKKNQRRH